MPYVLFVVCTLICVCISCIKVITMKHAIMDIIYFQAEQNNTLASYMLQLTLELKIA